MRGHAGCALSRTALVVTLLVAVSCAVTAFPNAKPGAAAGLVEGTAAQALVTDTKHVSVLADAGQLDAKSRSAVVKHTSAHQRVPASWKLAPAAKDLRDALSKGNSTDSTGTYINRDGSVTLYAVLPFDAHDGGYAANVLASNVSSTLPSAAVEAHGSKGVKVHVSESLMVHSLDTLASMSAVAAIEPRLQLTYHNAPEARILQSGEAYPSTGLDAAPFWKAGINGTGQLVQVGDSGLDVDHCMFSDNGNPIGSNHRSVQAYVEEYVPSVAELGEHGTHVTGSVLGRNVNTDPEESEDGVAFGARVHFTAFGEGVKLTYIPLPENYSDYFKRAYNNGARVSSNSWGLDTSRYTLATADIDDFLLKQNDSAVLYSAGNSGAYLPDNRSFETVGDPAPGKNSLAVGATVSAASVRMERPGLDFQVQDGNLMEPVPVLGVGNATPALTVSDVIPVDRCEQLFSNGNTDGQFAFASEETFQTCISRGLQDSETFAQPAAKFVPGFTCGPHVPFADREVNFLLDLLANATLPVPVVSMSSSRWTDIVALQRANGTLRSELKQRNVSDDAWKTLVTTFSSKGPTPDGRIKPDVVAPGLNISSARAGSRCGTMEETGTSMACPLTAGAVTLIRDYFSREHNLDKPSGTLVKAALINGAQLMRGYTYSTFKDPYATVVNGTYVLAGSGLYVDPYGELRSRRINGTVYDPYPLDSSPGCQQGWGRVDLSKSLPIDTDSSSPSNIVTYDNEAVIEANEWRRRIRVQSGEELRITLAWYDEAPSVLSAPFLVNDLDLEAHGETWSRPLVRRDDTNNVERIVMPNPPSEDVDIVVRGVRLPSEEQPFAVVATGNIASAETNTATGSSSSLSDLSTTSKGFLSALVISVVALIAVVVTGAVLYVQNRRKTSHQRFDDQMGASI